LKPQKQEDSQPNCSKDNYDTQEVVMQVGPLMAWHVWIMILVEKIKVFYTPQATRQIFVNGRTSKANKIHIKIPHYIGTTKVKKHVFLKKINLFAKLISINHNFPMCINLQHDIMSTWANKFYIFYK
jgi:hypothetical protein